MLMKEWVKVCTHKGFDIKVLNGAEEGDEFGYKVDSWVLWADTFPTVADAIAAIDELTNDDGWRA